ncbi:MAG: hypothetical protein U0U67_13880 [Chitinophagales bacterium]
MLEFLFGKKKNELQTIEYIWKNDYAKYKGILRMTDRSKPIIFIYYFIETKNQIQQLIETMQVSFSSDIYKQDKITITHAENILDAKIDLTHTTVCFIEHHPSFTTEHKILNYLENDLQIKEVIFHIALTEPLLHYFAGDKIVPLLEKMGFDENEALQHSMITRSIINAQKKIDDKNPNSIETQSAKHWFEVNLPK